MPTYEFECKKCEKQFDITMKISDYSEATLECNDCLIELERVFLTPPNFTIPSNCTYDGITKISGGSKKGRNVARQPINIIDHNPDGSVKVTRIGQKKDIDNE